MAETQPLSEKFSITSNFFVTKLTFESDRTRLVESKTFINLPYKVPLEFSRNSQSPENGCHCHIRKLVWSRKICSWSKIFHSANDCSSQIRPMVLGLISDFPALIKDK